MEDGVGGDTEKLSLRGNYKGHISPNPSLGHIFACVVQSQLKIMISKELFETGQARSLLPMGLQMIKLLLISSSDACASELVDGNCCFFVVGIEGLLFKFNDRPRLTSLLDRDFLLLELGIVEDFLDGVELCGSVKCFDMMVVFVVVDLLILFYFEKQLTFLKETNPIDVFSI